MKLVEKKREGIGWMSGKGCIFLNRIVDVVIEIGKCEGD